MISIILGLSGFAYTFYFLISQPAGGFSGFWDKSAALLLAAGPICIIFVSHNFIDFFAGIKVILKMAFLNQKREMNQISNQLTMISSIVRKDGVGAIAQFKNGIKNAFFREGLTLILNSFSVEEIRHNLTAKINTKQQQFAHAGNLFESLAKLSPGMGLLGTIIGLVLMLQNLSDPSKIGSGMAAALLTTLYGLILGNVVYQPIAEKITIYAEKTLQMDMLILEGVLLLKDKKSSAHFNNILTTYSSQNAQAQKGAPRPPVMRRG